MAFIGNTLKSLFHHDDKDPSPFTLSNDQISEVIYTTHVHSDIKLDMDTLFTLSENILKRSTHIVDNVLLGTHASPEHFDDKIPAPSFSSPLCTLRQIAAEMCCKPPGEKVAHKTTLAILNKLSHYAWEAKAVLTLAAFALEYGDFSLLAKFEAIDPLAKSAAILKRVPALTRPAVVQKHRPAIVELNSLIKATLQVIELIFVLEKFSSYDPKDVPALGPAKEKIPVDVYWAITTIVAIVSQIDALTTESELKQELSHFGQKINIVLSKLRQQITVIKQQIEIQWVGPIVSGLHHNIGRWVQEEMTEWMQQFTKVATSLANDSVQKEAKISIELFHVENKSLINKFWSGIESLFVTKVHKTVDTVTHEVQKLLSYKHETGWALLSKGSTVVASGHATTILKTVIEFDRWRELVIKKGFEFSFKEYHEKIVRATLRCLHLQISNIAGKLPETINCPYCPRDMEIFISYKWCRNDHTTNAIH